MKRNVLGNRSKPEKVLYVVENAVDSGGNRVIASYIKNERETNDVDVVFILRKITRFRDIAGLIKDYIGMFFKYRSQFSIACGEIDTGRYDRVVTTGRRTLEFIDCLDSNKHTHLIQHIEAWKSLQSPDFEKESKTRGYLSGVQTIDFILKFDDPDEYGYLRRLKKIRKFLTVSKYLSNILREVSPSSHIMVNEPPEISFPYNKFNEQLTRHIDVVFILRGLRFKGDALTEELINHYKKIPRVKMLVILSGKAKLRDRTIEILSKPNDRQLAQVYSLTKCFVAPSLSEGFGAIPREVIQYGANCVTSNTGWIQNSEKHQLLHIVEKHDLEEYVSKINAVIG